MDLIVRAWPAARQQAFAEWAAAGCAPARVIAEHRGAYLVCLEGAERMAAISGRLRHRACGRRDLPAVGDWVAVEALPGAAQVPIQAVLPRHSAFARRAAGPVPDEQILAANVDTALLVSGLDRDFRPRRIERYLTLAGQSGAAPVIVLNKADLCADPQGARLATEAIAGGAPILMLSALDAAGLQQLWPFLAGGKTGVLLGSSGVGKSTIVNGLLGRDQLRTAAVRPADSRGRHTTVQRQLIALPGGAALIDTPGMRELGLLGEQAALAQSFDDIRGLAAACRFRDCAHTGEPGCAVQEALADGRLDPGRYDSFLRQQRELRHHQREQDVHLRIAEKRRWKAILRSARQPRGEEQ